MLQRASEQNALRMNRHLVYLEEMMTFKNRTMKYLSVPVHLSIPTTRAAAPHFLPFPHSIQCQRHLLRQDSVQSRDMRGQICIQRLDPSFTERTLQQSEQ